MKPVASMVAAGLGTWLAAALVLDTRTWLEALPGMAGPLAATVATWLLVERTYRRAPERLTGRMAAAFGGKILFFGGYVAIMLKPVGLRPVPFVVSFTSYLILLYLVEALWLRRLFAGN
jgi:hypothetical protein